jgi:tetratricopeptide (TPR) repeat protein
MNTQVNDAIALVKQGIQLAGQQRLDEAVASLDGAIALKPDFVEALIVRGIVLFDLGRHEDAVASYDRVLALGPDAQAFGCRGMALYSLGRFDEAVASFDRALELQPDAEAFDTRGAALYKLGRFDEALASYDSALALRPDAEVFTRRGAALHDLSRFGEAVASYDAALALAPDYVEALNSRGVALDNLRRHDEALASYDRALALKPDHAKTHWNRSLVLLRKGDLKRGFEAYRWRFLANEAPRTAFTCPEWQGEPLAGKRLAVFHEQGYGDTLQFVRYLPMAQALGAQVTLLVPQALIRLMRASLPGVEVVTHVSKADVFDFHAPMLSLPAMFGTTLDTIPARTPYLIADPAEAENWAQRLAALPGLARPGLTRPDLKVGLVWAGGKKMPIADARRSLKLAQFAPLAAIPGIRIVSLQIGEPAEEAKAPPAGLQLTDWTSEIRDYADTAALVAALDLVITVDTSVAHLVGGLGKPVWILSRYDGCWRWLLDRSDSPWYPTARLFHQPAPGEWEPVIADLAAALRTLASESPAREPASAAADPLAASTHRIEDAIAFVKQGFQRFSQNRLDEAVASFDRALALKPDFAEALLSRGVVLFELGRFEEAIASYDRLLALGPDAQAFSCRGAALYNLGRLDEAVASYDRALDIQPDADAFKTRGAALYKLGRLDEAAASYDRALALEPDAEAFAQRGAALSALGRLDEAVASYDQALQLAPDAEIFNNRGAALYTLGRFGEAVASCDRALALEPDYAGAHLNRALALLRAGDLARGFQAYRWRFRISDGSWPKLTRPDWLACPDWEGEPLASKRLVVFHEQGYGDTLQFVRYVPMAAALGAQITLLVPPTLVRLLRQSLPGVDVVDGLSKTAVFDFQAPMLSLPAMFGTTLDTVPARTPYLLADQAAAASWAQRLAALPDVRPELKVGLVWAGKAGRPYDERRSLKLAQLAPLAALPGMRFISLQIGESTEKSNALPAGLRLTDWTNEIADFADTAALIANLDLVITVDTSVAHLAGALGRPVWILSRRDGCWRWLPNREDSPWYPTARVFHQRTLGEWEPVVADLAAALQAFSSQHASMEEPAPANPPRTGDAVALLNHGVQLAAQQRFDEALADFDKAIALDAGLAEAFNNRGAALYKLGRFDDAVASYDRALALEPDAETYSSRGLALHVRGRLDEALASYDSALALKPDYTEAHYNRALTLLRAGDLARGFQAYRWRFRINAARPAIACPEWEGEPIAGKRLAIFHEQGAGDTLQFVRYVPMALARGAQITLLVPPVLARLLRASLPGVEVVDRLPNSAVFDFQAPMLSLPALFGTTLDTVPARTPYLTVDPAEAASWAQRLAALPDLTQPDLKVGLVWAGSKMPTSYDARRSLKLAQLAPLAALPGIRFVSLQIGEPAAEAKTPPTGLQLTDWTSEIRDYADTAALIANLDLVITVDTSVAHLAGALDKPVWILSRYDGCWRWLLGRDDSPWYPTARLFHQPAMGDWQPVIADVAAALQALSAAQA